MRSVGRSNFEKGLHNLITLIKKRHKIMIEIKLLFYVMESRVHSHEKRNTIYIYTYIYDNMYISNELLAYEVANIHVNFSVLDNVNNNNN